jgi:signal transduction histidine kinase
LVTSRLQGRINLYSKVGKGTRFTIDIPKVVGEAHIEAPADPQRQLQGA